MPSYLPPLALPPLLRLLSLVTLEVKTFEGNRMIFVIFGNACDTLKLWCYWPLHLPSLALPPPLLLCLRHIILGGKTFKGNRIISFLVFENACETLRRW